MQNLTKSKNILIVEPSTSGLSLLTAAHQSGMNVFVLTANRDERIIPEPYKKFIYKQIEIDTNDIENCGLYVKQLHAQYSLSAIIPGFEIFVETAAYLSRLVNLPSLSKKTAEALRNKGKMRDALKACHIRVPRYVMLKSCDEINDVAQYVKFPCVIKPIDQSGSIHVRKIENIDDLSQAYNMMCYDPWTEMGKGIGSVAIIEEYIYGTEFSIEGYVDKTGCYIVSVTQKKLSTEPFFVELGHIVQANINQHDYNRIISYIKNVVDALKINLGVFHAELRLDQNGPVLMEIAGRLAGDKICELIFLSSGINLPEIMIKSHQGKIINLNPYPFNQYAGIHFFYVKNKTSYKKIEGIDKINQLKGFQEFKLLIDPNQPIPPLTSFLGRVAYCIFTAPTYQALESQLKHADEIIRFI